MRKDCSRSRLRVHSRRLIILAALAIFVLASLAGCSKSTKPKEVKYNIYIGTASLPECEEGSACARIYIYDADNLGLLDSVVREQRPEALAASPDGRFLYIVDRVVDNPYSRLSKIDIVSKDILWTRSNTDVGGRRQIRLLADGALVFMGNGVLRSEDGGLIRRFSDSMLTMYGPLSGSKVAAFRDSIVAIIDAATGESTGRFVPRLSNGVVLDLIYIRLHPDGKRVSAIGLYGSVDYSWFVVGDVTTGETLYQYRLSLPRGEIGISDSGSVAVVTDPPGMWGLDPTLSIIDLDHLALIARVTTNLARQSQVRFLPGNTKAVLAPPSQSFGSGPLQILDPNDMTVQTVPLGSPYGPFIGGLDIGPRL